MSYRRSPRLRPLDPTSSDSSDSDSVDEVDITDRGDESIPSIEDIENNLNDVELEDITQAGADIHIVDDPTPGTSRPRTSATTDYDPDPFPFDAFPTLYNAPPPTPGGPSRVSPLPFYSPRLREVSPQAGPSTGLQPIPAGRSSSSIESQPGSSSRAGPSTRPSTRAASNSQPLQPGKTSSSTEPQSGGSAQELNVPSTTTKSASGIVTGVPKEPTTTTPEDVTATVPPHPTPAQTNLEDTEGDKGKFKSTLRRVYSDLIETCQGFDEREGLESDLQNIMTANIFEGNRLFKGLRRMGGGPGDMYMAFLHTQMCSQMIRYKSYTIGSATSGFKLDLFLKSLTAEAKNSLNEYDPRMLIKKIAERSALACKTPPFLVCISGAFDREKLSTQKEKKQRAPPRKRIFDQNQTVATMHEEVNISQRNETDSTKSPEILKQEIFKILKRLHTINPSPHHRTNLFEFCLDKHSLANTVEYLFYVGFLIRDGYIGLNREKSSKSKEEKPGDSVLVIQPDKPVQKSLLHPEKDDTSDVCRNQYILSFSPRLWKALAAVASGEDIITKYKSVGPT